MIVTIQSSSLSGTVLAPPAKSLMQRACAAALLVRGVSVLHKPGFSNDDRAALKIIQNLGAKVRETGDITIESAGINPVTSQINCGESGLGIRMFTPIAALSENEIRIHAQGTLINRPLSFFEDILPQLNVKIKSRNGKLPFTIQGPLIPQNITINCSLSSQFLTGLLMVYAASNAQNVTIQVKDLKSRQYIDLTLQVMKMFGLKLPENRNYQEFFFSTGLLNGAASGENLRRVSYTVEGDWSSGAFLLVAGAIAGPVNVRGLDLRSHQPDKAILDALENANADVIIGSNGIKINPSKLMAFDFDATDCPDLFPPLVALASYCKGISRIKGINRLLFKESNRAITLQEEFRKMGVQITLKDSYMHIKAEEKLKSAKINSHKDHRIAMSCAIAALKAQGDTMIKGAHAVCKSYPNFFDDLIKLNANVSCQYRKI